MEQHKEEIGTRQDLALYRIQTAKSDLKSARILLAAEEYKGANNRAYYDDFYIASREESERQIAVADEFIQLVEQYFNAFGTKCQTNTER